MAKITFPVSGMTCAACQSFVQKTLEGRPGVQAATVNLMLHNATVSYDPALVNPHQLVETVEETGYGASLPEARQSALQEQEAHDRDQDAEYRDLRRKAAFALLAGVMAMASMGTHSGPSSPLWWFHLLLTVATMAWAGRRFYVKAWSAARHRTSDMNTLIALGTGSAFVFSLLSPHQNYFESVIFIIALVLVGNTLEARARRQTAAALRGLAALQPATAQVERQGSEITIPTSDIRPDDVILCRPGQRIVADGVVVDGTGAVDESMLTGEAIPVEKAPGSAVMGGTLNQHGLLRIRPTALGAESVLDQVIRLLRAAQGAKAPMQRLADRISALFVPTVVGIALVTLAVWLLLGGGARSFTAALSVLIIACPCAMGLAVPAAIMVSTGRAARLGLLVRDGETLEWLEKVDTVVFDKTGTLTEGRPKLVETAGPEPDAGLTLAASLETASEHPLAKALVDAAGDRNLLLARPTRFIALPGSGAQGEVSGQQILIGKRALLAASQIDPAALDAVAAPLGAQGMTLLWLAVDGCVRNVFAIADAPRASARTAVKRLQSSGVRVMLLTGDQEPTARAIAAQVGISTADVIAGVLPAGKLDAIAALQKQGRVVAMVGDGINDAPALTQADAGLAMATGSDIALDAAGVTLMRPDLNAVADALDLSKATLRVMRQNLFWAFFYNAIGIPIAAGVLYPTFGILLSPILASAAMALSSVSVVTNSLRLGRSKP